MKRIILMALLVLSGVSLSNAQDNKVDSLASENNGIIKPEEVICKTLGHSLNELKLDALNSSEIDSLLGAICRRDTLTVKPNYNWIDRKVAVPKTIRYIDSLQQYNDDLYRILEICVAICNDKDNTIQKYLTEIDNCKAENEELTRNNNYWRNLYDTSVEAITDSARKVILTGNEHPSVKEIIELRNKMIDLNERLGKVCDGINAIKNTAWVLDDRVKQLVFDYYYDEIIGIRNDIREIKNDTSLLDLLSKEQKDYFQETMIPTLDNIITNYLN